MPLVLVESPFAGDITANVDYARLCLRDALSRGEAPIASHLLLTQATVLDEKIPVQRTLGMDSGLAWLRAADASVVYIDRGISSGMSLGVETARGAGVPVEFRLLDGYVAPVVTAPDPHAPDRGLVVSLVSSILREGWWMPLLLCVGLLLLMSDTFLVDAARAAGEWTRSWLR
jgi:hypothetical protein